MIVNRIVALVLALLVYSNSLSQEFKEYEIKRLNAFGIELEPGKQMNKNHALDFKMILEKERKRRKNKTTGVILSSLGVISTAYGIFVLSNTTEDGQEIAIKDTVGGLLLGYGIISGGVSIPLFKSAKKKRKERDKLIVRYFELQ